MIDWQKTEVLITGGTGSLGKVITKILLRDYHPRGIRIFSRDEHKHWLMQQEVRKWGFEGDTAYLIGDVRDPLRLKRAMERVNLVIHLAALKQVPLGEENPREPVLTNILGSLNVINAALDCQIDKAILVSSDKAVYPINLYGATKAVAEKLWIHANTYGAWRKPLFAACRYGNVIGSRGSVIPLFKDQVKELGYLTLTDINMTRFWITLPKIARFILNRAADMTGGEIFIPDMGTASTIDVCRWLYPGADIRISGIRSGEKIHEAIVTREERPYLCEVARGDYDRYFRIASPRDRVTGSFRLAEAMTSENWNRKLDKEVFLTMVNEEI